MKTYSDPRRQVTIENWPSGVQVAAQIEDEMSELLEVNRIVALFYNGAAHSARQAFLDHSAYKAQSQRIMAKKKS